MASQYPVLSRNQRIAQLLERDSPVATHVLNPLTNRKIKIGGPTYNKLVKNGTITPPGTTAIPPPPPFQDIVLNASKTHPIASLVRKALKKGIKLRKQNPIASLVRKAHKNGVKLRPIPTTTLMQRALKGYTKSYKVGITHSDSE